MQCWPALGIRCKLIIIFIFIKVLPLIVLAWIAWNGITMLGYNLKDKVENLANQTLGIIDEVSDLAVKSSIRALDLKSRDNIERLTTDTARALAAFLYDRDNDILMAASIKPNADAYRRFLAPRLRTVIEHRPWIMNEAGDAWVPKDAPPAPGPTVTPDNPDNARDFHYRQPDNDGIRVKRPLYLEMTFIDLDGNEKVKITNSDFLTPEKRNVSDRANTYCKAETYFEDLKKLRPGDIYVSEVIGPYLRSPIIGPYTRKRAEEKGIPFKPEEAAYAGKENPVGKRFQGIIRWAAPVVRDGRTIGWVTLAMDHTHVMEFSDHLVPTDKRYSSISDAGSGNYAFIWDYKDRNISHPRDYFIAGYDPETGDPAVPWLEETLYDDFMSSGKNISEWEKTAPVMQDQSLENSPSKALRQQGLLGLDCRYLDFAPQCQGWYNLTKDGGSGSFVIFWSGLWKLTTAAAIPYFTGRYGETPRGFGFITIGANVNEFHKAATNTGDKIRAMAARYGREMAEQNKATQIDLRRSLHDTAENITYSTLLMIALVILIAIWIASTLTGKITRMIRGIQVFQKGNMEHRLTVESTDEIGQLAEAFNDMANDIQSLISSLRQAEYSYRGFFENATEGIFRSRENGEPVNVNPAFAQLFGFDSAEEMLENIKHVGEDLYVMPEHRKELIRQLDEHGKVTGFEYEVKHLDGSVRTLQASCYWITDKDGERYIEGMSTDITKQKQAVEALEKAKERAEQLSLMKSNFLSMVSHELRTPLTSILGFAKLIQRSLDSIRLPANPGEGTRETLDRIQQNTSVIIAEGDRLTELINNVLDLTKLEAGRFDWNIAYISIQEVLDHSLAATQVLFSEKGLAVEKDIAPDLPHFSGDHDRLVQVCINLLSNAAKFTKEGGVHCQVSLKDNNILVRIADTGEGVPDNEADSIFDKFRQLGDTLTNKPKGSGLGLPICKEIVEHLGGRIWYEPNPGGGTVFLFSIPVHPKNPLDD